MTVFHGSTEIIRQPLVNAGRRNLDFGTGFYVTDLREQAVFWANRRGEERWQAYDLIEGGIANDRVFNTIELYAAGLTPREEALEKLRYEKPNNQLCLLRQELVDRYLHFIKAEEVTPSIDAAKEVHR